MDNARVLAALKSLAAIYELAATALPGLHAFGDEQSYKAALGSAHTAGIINAIELRRLRIELLSLGFDTPDSWLTTNPVLAVDFHEDHEGNRAVGVLVDDRKALTAVLREIRAAIMRLENFPAPLEGDDAPLGKLELALARLVTNPEWTDKKILESVGVHPNTKHKPAWKPYQRARELMKAALPKGSKGADGSIEAIADD